MIWPRLKRRKSTALLPDLFSDASTIYNASQSGEQTKLSLPTKVEDVVSATHEQVPQRLPGESEDEVRYFLFSVLTVKTWRISRKYPQWVLETCAYWRGDGNKLRSLSSEGFAELCPLFPVAKIDWRDTKFEQEYMPPPEARLAIGTAVERVVSHIKLKAGGNQRPGFQTSEDLRKSARTMASGMSYVPGHNLPYQARPSIPSYASDPACTSPQSFYGLNNPSMPLLHQTSSYGLQPNPMFIQQFAPYPSSEYKMPRAEPMQRMISPEHRTLRPQGSVCSVLGARSPPPCSPPPSNPASPTSSYCQTASISSRLSESTTKTSPPSSDSEAANFWSAENDRTSSTARSIHDSGIPLPDMQQDSVQRTGSRVPARYKSTKAVSITQQERPHGLTSRMLTLRGGSHSNAPSSIYAPSLASLTPSDCPSARYASRRDSAMPSEIRQSDLGRQPSIYPGNGSHMFSPPVARNHGNAYSPRLRSTVTASIVEGSILHPGGSAHTKARSNVNSVRPEKNFQVDDNAFESARRIGLKPKPSLRTMKTESQGNHVIRRGKTDTGLSQRMNNFFGKANLNESSVGPIIRFQDPRTGQPRLTMFEHIDEEQREQKLRKQHLESQKRVGLWQGRDNKTVFETIVEQEEFTGKPQRGVDNNVENEWSGYF